MLGEASATGVESEPRDLAAENNHPIHPVTLTFQNEALEQEFRVTCYAKNCHHGLVAIGVGTVVYLLLGLLDPWLIVESNQALVWQIRLTALCVPLLIATIQLAGLFKTRCSLLQASVGLAAGLGLIAIQTQMPINSAVHLYPAMIMVTFYTYNFIGTKFIYALGVDLILLTTYNTVFGIYFGYPLEILVVHDLLIICANLIGGSAGYLHERQDRLLFLKERELRLERQHHMHRALHDPLTDLPNRELLYDRLNQALHLAERRDITSAGLFIDLDNFKLVNDRFGHQSGDQVLQVLAQRLLENSRSGDTVARIGGDEFFVLAVGVGGEEETRKVAERLLAAVNEPIPPITESVALGASIGIAMLPYPGVTAEDLIHRADHAMYDIKHRGKHAYAFYRDEEHANNVIGLSVASDPESTDLNEREQRQQR